MEIEDDAQIKREGSIHVAKISEDLNLYQIRRLQKLIYQSTSIVPKVTPSSLEDTLPSPSRTSYPNPAATAYSTALLIHLSSIPATTTPTTTTTSHASPPSRIRRPLVQRLVPPLPRHRRDPSAQTNTLPPRTGAREIGRPGRNTRTLVTDIATTGTFL